MAQIIVIEDIKKMLQNLTNEAKEELLESISMSGEKYFDKTRVRARFHDALFVDETRVLADFLKFHIDEIIDSPSDKLIEIKKQIINGDFEKKLIIHTPEIWSSGSWSDESHYKIYYINGNDSFNPKSYVLFFDCDVDVVNTCAKTGGLKNFLTDFFLGLRFS